MKYMLIKLICFYQKIPGKFHDSCRHIPTCSNYAIEAIEYYGACLGTIMAVRRILRCNPWGTYGYDPVLKKEKKNEKNS